MVLGAVYLRFALTRAHKGSRMRAPTHRQPLFLLDFMLGAATAITLSCSTASVLPHAKKKSGASLNVDRRTERSTRTSQQVFAMQTRRDTTREREGGKGRRWLALRDTEVRLLQSTRTPFHCFSRLLGPVLISPHRPSKGSASVQRLCSH